MEQLKQSSCRRLILIHLELLFARLSDAHVNVTALHMWRSAMF